jgi:hypothetical protein
MKIKLKSDPFKKIIKQDKILKDFAVAFQQAMECIIEGKADLAENFKEEMTSIKAEMDEYSRSICFNASPSGVSSSLYYLYIQYEIQITEKMTGVLDWILARKSPINSDPIETELFVIADSAADTIDKLTSLSEKLSTAAKKFKNKKAKQDAAIIIDEIIEKSKKTFNLSLRMKRKILETETDSPSLIHLVFLADMIGQVSEKTRDTAWLATSLSCL